MSALLINGVPIQCINEAAIQYYVPATLIISVLTIENGKIGEAHHNLNGTVDYGPMQINSIWLNEIQRYGYSQEKIQYDPCANVAVGAWILSQAIANSKTLWQGVGNYHSHSIFKNRRYRYKVKEFYYTLNYYLRGIGLSKKQNNRMLKRIKSEESVMPIIYTHRD